MTWQLGEIRRDKTRDIDQEILVLLLTNTRPPLHHLSEIKTEELQYFFNWQMDLHVL